MEQIPVLATLILRSFGSLWPYLLITIPLAVAVKMSGASRYIDRAFAGRPATAILLATAVGAFSPFCSCGVIPVVATLLMGGVPLPPVMSFWIASPSMDPEMFFLSVATLGWPLAIARLVATCAISLAAGFVTLWLTRTGWLGRTILRRRPDPDAQPLVKRLKHAAVKLAGAIRRLSPVPQPLCCTTAGTMAAPAAGACGCSAADPVEEPRVQTNRSCACGGSSAAAAARPTFAARLVRESIGATIMVGKFMLLALALEAVIKLYVPSAWISAALGPRNPWSILVAALVGVPVYTSNLTALPMVAGLLSGGMNPGAALAFLISGPMTTLPAMAAVWGLVNRRVFALYILFALLGAVVAGYAYALVGLLF